MKKSYHNQLQLQGVRLKKELLSLPLSVRQLDIDNEKLPENKNKMNRKKSRKIYKHIP